MHLENSGLIFDATARPASQRVAAFVSLCPLRSGSILCGFQLGSRKHDPASTIGLCRSRDGGETWEQLPTRFEHTLDGIPGSLGSAEMVEVEPGRLLLLSTWFDRSDPDRPLFDPDTEGILHSRQLRAFSADEGRSWSSWEPLVIPGLTGCSSCGPLLKWPDGTIAYPFESYKEFDDPSPANHGAWLLVSRDGGRTFDAPLLVAQDPRHKVYYWDQRLCIGAGRGEFIGMFWTHYLEQKKDLAVHFRRASLHDNDFRKLPITRTDIPGQISAPLMLEDGRLLTFVVYRGKPATMTLWQSGDGGTTWPKSDSLVVYTHQEQAMLSQGDRDVDYAQYWEDMTRWSFGHPAIRPLGDGRVLLAFYAGTPDCMSVRWARVNTAEC